jgi:2-methylcitrate dehydratase PrpD
LGPQQLAGRSLHDPLILSLADRVQLIEDKEYNARFPAQRIARAEILLTDDTVLRSGEHQPAWESNTPPRDAELRQKFRWLAGELVARERVEELENIIWHVAESPTVMPLVSLMSDPPRNDSGERRLSS